MKGADNIVEMKIGSGTKNGEKIRGYAPRCGKSLCELLKQNREINIKSMGGAATNNAVKAIAHAQNLLEEENLGLIADSFVFKTEHMIREDGAEVDGVLLQIHTKLVA